MNKKMANQTPALEAGHGKMHKNSKKPSKQESNKEKQKVKTEGMKPADEEAQLNTSLEDAVAEENKENLDAPPTEEIIS